MPSFRNLRAQFASVLFAASFVVLLASPNFCQKLPLRKFTAADGLAQDNVNRIVKDSRGFLWFCTSDGLSRFDGSRFKNYTQQQGLPHRNINDLLETSDGVYLVASSSGVSVFDPYGAPVGWDVLRDGPEDPNVDTPLFRTFVPPEDSQVRAWRAVSSLAQQPGSGIIYAGTNNGLFKFTGSGRDWRFEKVAYEGWLQNELVINGLLTDVSGGVWVAAASGVYRIDRAGAITTIDKFGSNYLFQDRSGLVWVDSGGHDLGIRTYHMEDDKAIPVRLYTTADGLYYNPFARPVAQSPTGEIYVTSSGGLQEFKPEATGNEPKFVAADPRIIQNGAMDVAGNLWFGTSGSGVLKLPVGAVTTFPGRSKEGLIIGSIYFDDQARPYISTGQPIIERLVDARFEGIKPTAFAARLWSETFLDLQTSTGEWWFPTAAGVFRFPAVKDLADLAHTQPKNVYGVHDGLPEKGAFNLFEDSTGDVWINFAGETTPFKWDHTTEKIEPVPDFPGITKANGSATSYGEDSSGNLWISFSSGGLIRLRQGQVRKFDGHDGIPEGFISDFHSDRNGRFWIATRSRGLFRVDDPNSETPSFRNISTHDGLRSNQANCLAEDRFGRIYVGTGRGLHRIDPASGSVRIYTEFDGLPGNNVYRCREDPNGDIWFVAADTLGRLIASPDSPNPAPTTFIDGFSVNGTLRRISELGETELSGVDLDAGENRIEINYFALEFGSGETTRYQYRLGDGEWSPPSSNTSVTFDLSPGSYSFAVRGVAADGRTSERPSTASFSIARPLWQRWWFLVLAFLLVGGSVFALDRFRVAKTRQVKNALAKSVESETRFRTLAATASDAIITIEEDSSIVYVNEAVERIFGYAPDEIVGKKLTDLMPERMRGAHDAGLARYVRTSTKNIGWNGVTLPGLRKDGTEVPLELSFGEFVLDGKRYFTGIARDITERLRAEEEIRKAREERMRELQKVRSRIATDLHDDIGSSLTQIAVLSEVARGQANALNADGISTPLERIKNVSKELVAVMSDIVWAINPQKDYLHDLVQRMRRFGSDVLSGRGIAFEFSAPDMDDAVELGANIRREVFAIFKETVNNAAKYSECSHLVTVFSFDGDRLNLRVTDDGIGFDTAVVLSSDFRPEMGGNGLISIRRRAVELGGTCDIRSSPGNGTDIAFSIPLGPQQNGG